MLSNMTANKQCYSISPSPIFYCLSPSISPLAHKQAAALLSSAVADVGSPGPGRSHVSSLSPPWLVAPYTGDTPAYHHLLCPWTHLAARFDEDEAAYSHLEAETVSL